MHLNTTYRNNIPNLRKWIYYATKINHQHLDLSFNIHVSASVLVNVVCGLASLVVKVIYKTKPSLKHDKMSKFKVIP